MVPSRGAYKGAVAENRSSSKGKPHSFKKNEIDRFLLSLLWRLGLSQDSFNSDLVMIGAILC